MKIKSTIIFAMALLVIIAGVALVGGVLQKAQDAGTSASDPGFVPSTGQINLGKTPKLPSGSDAIAR